MGKEIQANEIKDFIKKFASVGSAENDEMIDVSQFAKNFNINATVRISPKTFKSYFAPMSNLNDESIEQKTCNFFNNIKKEYTRSDSSYFDEYGRHMKTVSFYCLDDKRIGDEDDYLDLVYDERILRYIGMNYKND